MPDSDTPNVCQASCEAPTPDGVFLCKAHTGQLTDALRTVPGLVEDLEVTITRQARTAGPKHGARSATRPLPWNEHASSCRVELNAILNAWAYETHHHRPDSRDPLDAIHSSDTAELANWLRAHLHTANHLDTAGDLFAEILDAITQATRAVDLPPERKFIGTCKQPLDDGKPCREDLFAMPRQHIVSCRNCGHRHDADVRREELLGQIEDQLVHAGLLSNLVTDFGVPVVSATIRSWAHRGRLPVKGNDKNRRPLYRVGDVLDLALRRADAA